MRLGDTADSLTSWQPLARHDQLVMNEVEDEVLVYDLASHAIHHLNAASTAVWRRCDGHTSVPGIARTAGMTEETVRVALAKLADAGLLRDELPVALRGPGSSRRTFMKKVAIAGTIPAIVSVTAPLAAQAGSIVFVGTCNLILTGEEVAADCSEAVSASASCCTSLCTSAGGTVESVELRSCRIFENITESQVDCFCRA